MSDAIQWIIVAALVTASVVYLVKRLRPSKKGCCCAGCPYQATCTMGKDEQAKCVVPEQQPGAESARAHHRR